MLKDENLKLQNEKLNTNEKDEIIIGDNNPINIEDNLYEEIKSKKVNFSEDSRERAMNRIKRMKEKQKEEREKNKVRKSIKIKNIVKTLEETMKSQKDEE